ncbi:hypothetical protein V6N13_098969 [Hibiscus sabdariffa]
MGEVIARELAEACCNDKGIRAFPCIISALCRRAAIPACPTDKYTPCRTGWTRKDYMWKMDLTDAVPLQTAMPEPPAPEHQPQASPLASPAVVPAQPQEPTDNPVHNPAHTPKANVSFSSTPATPIIPPAATTSPSPAPTLASPPAAASPPPAPAVDVSPLHLLQLHNQLQRIEARHLNFIEETKDFPPGVINLGRRKIIQEVAVIRSCTDAALTKDPESTQAENSSTCRDIYLGRQGKYNRECDMISIFFQTPLD